MKVLIILCIFQTIGIILIAGILLQQDHKPTQLLPDIQPYNNQSDIKYQSPTNDNINRPNLNENQIRQIIRSELVSVLAQKAPKKQMDDTQNKAIEPVSIELREAKDNVSQEIDYYISNGEISPAQMSKLQAKIARLDTKGRKQMFGKLVSAMNSGRLDGQL